MFKYWRIPPSDRFLYRRRAEFITGVWENAAFAADTGLRGKERALTHSERQSGCRDGDFTSWSSIVLPFSPYYVKPLIILGRPEGERIEKRNERCYFPRFYIMGPGKSDVCPTRNHWSHMQISFSSHGVLWEFRVFGIHVNWRVSWTASSSSLFCAGNRMVCVKNLHSSFCVREKRACVLIFHAFPEKKRNCTGNARVWAHRAKSQKEKTPFSLQKKREKQVSIRCNLAEEKRKNPSGILGEPMFERLFLSQQHPERRREESSPNWCPGQIARLRPIPPNERTREKRS